jgi:hypothetical protein
MKFIINKVKSYSELLNVLIILSIISLSLTSSLSGSRLKRSYGNSRSETRTKRMKNDLDNLNLLSNDISKDFDISIAKNFRYFAGLGYVDSNSATEQINEIETAERIEKTKVSYLFRVLFEIQKWKHIKTKTYRADADDYCFTIIEKKEYKKMIFSFSGTKTTKQLVKEGLNSDGVSYNEQKPYIKIMKYFFELYGKIKTDLKRYFNDNKHPDITQYIFTGHSLGGAIASVALFDFMEEGLITKTDISPVLITYGQPRAGNYAFANELVKNVPILYRFYNNHDFVGSVPACHVENDRCISEFGKTELDEGYNNYQNDYNQLSDSVKNKFYPFHTSGLIFIKGDTKETVLNCSRKSELAPHDECKGEILFNFEFHTVYFGYQISNMGNPTIYPYDGNFTKQKDGRDIVKFTKTKTFDGLEAARNEHSLRNTAINTVTAGVQTMLKKTGLSHVKKFKK